MKRKCVGTFYCCKSCFYCFLHPVHCCWEGKQETSLRRVGLCIISLRYIHISHNPQVQHYHRIEIAPWIEMLFFFMQHYVQITTIEIRDFFHSCHCHLLPSTIPVHIIQITTYNIKHNRRKKKTKKKLCNFIHCSGQQSNLFKTYMAKIRITLTGITNGPHGVPFRNLIMYLVID